MKTYAKILVLLAASCLAFVSVSRAQPTTFTTQPAYSGSAFTFGASTTLGQTFSNVYSVSSMTYNFFIGAGGSTSSTNLTATFGQWNGSSFIAGTTVTFGTITIPPSSAWTASLTNSFNTYSTYQLTFDLTNTGSNPIINSTLASPVTSGVTLDSVYGYMTSPSSTYALLLTNTGGASNLALGLTNTDAFAYGSASPLNFNDWTFAQIAVQTSNPVPESSTVAAILGATLVAGLVIFRLRQQRQLVPVSATAA